MHPIVKLAIRNVGRNKRRSLITLMSVVAGAVVVTQARSLINGLQGEMIEAITRKANGDLQIHRANYQDLLDASPFDLLVPFSTEAETALKSEPSVDSLTGRVRIFALLNNQRTQKTTPVMVTGIDLNHEFQVCPRLREALVDGRFFEPIQKSASLQKAEAVDEVEELSEEQLTQVRPQKKESRGGDVQEVMMTPQLARGLQAKLGDEIVILMKDPNKMEQAIIAKLVGTIDLNLPIAAGKMAWLDLSMVQDRLGIGSQVTEVAVRMTPKSDLHETQANIQTLMKENFIVERWDQLAGFFSDVMGLQNTIFKAVFAIMFMIVSLAVVNTSLMTVTERTREIGTLMAIGYQRKHILSIFLIESAFIGVLGGLMGVTLATILVSIENHFGIPFTFPGTQRIFTLRPFTTVSFVATVLGISATSALLASLYPAYRASRLRPVQALSST